MRSAGSRFSKLLPAFLIPVLLCGCGKKLPDPQVIHNPPRMTATAEYTATATASPVPSAISATATVSPEPTETPAASAYDVPVLSQEGLLLNGIPTGVGCVPVCIEMITAWWNSVSPEFPVLTAQETIDRNAEQGLYAAGRGMTSASAADELAERGYIHRMELNSSKEELIEIGRAHV